jgi:hypothetical protein
LLKLNQKGNHFEIFFALELLVHLSFNKEIQEDLKTEKNKDLIDILNVIFKKELEKLTNHDEKEICKQIKNLVQIIKWNLLVKTQKTSFKQC